MTKYMHTAPKKLMNSYGWVFLGWNLVLKINKHILGYVVKPWNITRYSSKTHHQIRQKQRNGSYKQIDLNFSLLKIERQYLC